MDLKEDKKQKDGGGGISDRPITDPSDLRKYCPQTWVDKNTLAQFDRQVVKWKKAVATDMMNSYLEAIGTTKRSIRDKKDDTTQVALLYWLLSTKFNLDDRVEESTSLLMENVRVARLKSAKNANVAAEAEALRREWERYCDLCLSKARTAITEYNASHKDSIDEDLKTSITWRTLWTNRLWKLVNPHELRGITLPRLGLITGQQQTQHGTFDRTAIPSPEYLDDIGREAEIYVQSIATDALIRSSVETRLIVMASAGQYVSNHRLQLAGRDEFQRLANRKAVGLLSAKFYREMPDPAILLGKDMLQGLIREIRQIATDKKRAEEEKDVAATPPTALEESQKTLARERFDLKDAAKAITYRMGEHLQRQLAEDEEMISAFNTFKAEEILILTTHRSIFNEAMSEFTVRLRQLVDLSHALIRRSSASLEAKTGLTNWQTKLRAQILTDAREAAKAADWEVRMRNMQNALVTAISSRLAPATYATALGRGREWYRYFNLLHIELSNAALRWDEMKLAWPLLKEYESVPTASLSFGEGCIYLADSLARLNKADEYDHDRMVASAGAAAIKAEWPVSSVLKDSLGFVNLRQMTQTIEQLEAALGESRPYRRDIPPAATAAAAAPPPAARGGPADSKYLPAAAAAAAAPRAPPPPVAPVAAAAAAAAGAGPINVVQSYLMRTDVPMHPDNDPAYGFGPNDLQHTLKWLQNLTEEWSLAEAAEQLAKSTSAFQAQTAEQQKVMNLQIIGKCIYHDLIFVLCKLRAPLIKQHVIDLMNRTLAHTDRASAAAAAAPFPLIGQEAGGGEDVLM